MNNFELSVKRFDEFALEYAERFMNIDPYITHLENFSELTKKQNPKILELACGPGNVTRYLNKKFRDAVIIAIDLAPKMIDIAKQHVTGVDFRIMDVRDVLTLNSQFDSIMCSFCLPFLSKNDAYKLIADCSEKLHKNGILYISTMEGNELKAGFEPTSFSGDAEVYFNYHKETDLRNALSKNGFIIEYNIQQDYTEPNGSLTTDLIFIARKS